MRYLPPWSGHVDTALSEGAGRILLAARVTARDYARHGYAIEADEFTEVTIPHVTMSKRRA